MEYIDYKDISELIAKGEVNYISFVMTPWHLIGSKAAIRYLINEGIEIKPLIISSPHPETGFAVVQDEEYPIFQLQNVGSKTNIIRYVFFLIYCWITASKCETKLFFANAWYGNFKSIFWLLPSIKSKFQLIIFEEGIGAYRKEYYTLKNPLIKRNLLQKIQLGADLCLSRRFFKKGRLINLNPLKYGDDGKLFLNDVAVRMYKEALGVGSLDLNSRKVVLLTQETDGEIYRVINDLSQYLSSYNIEVYIKAHPRFPIDTKLLTSKVNMIEHSIAVESVLQTIKTQFVISFNTTALLSLRYLYDVTTISLIHCVREDCCQGLFNPGRPFNTWFEDTFSGVVLFPKDIKELQLFFKKESCLIIRETS